MPSLYLVDASPYVFRAYYSLPSSLRRPDGEPAGGSYGFTRFVLQILQREDLEFVAFAFDRSLTSSFRNEIDPDYKANRESPPDELKRQFADCMAVCAALGVTTIDSERYEADDLIASLLRLHQPTVEKTVLVSSDKDLAQLVDDDVVLFDFAKTRWFDRAAVRSHFGVDPTQICDLLALQGDAVDNIKGVPGIGAKSAQALLEHFRGLEELLADPESVTALPIRGAKRIAGLLAEHAESARLSMRLARLADDAPVPRELETLRWNGADPAAVEREFDRMGFQRFRDQVPRWVQSAP